MKVSLSIIGWLACASIVCAGGNKELMTKGEADLRGLNKKVLKQVPKNKIPKEGRIKVSAKVKNTKPEPEITNVKVKTISTSTTQGK